MADVMPDMRAKYFRKYGLDTKVPGHLKGLGKVQNLRYGRDFHLALGAQPVAGATLEAAECSLRRRA
jgi:hypothetical protein